jgi:hypothetical protein
MSTPSPHKAEVPSLPGGSRHVAYLSEELLQNKIVLRTEPGSAVHLFATTLRFCLVMNEKKQGVHPSEVDGFVDARVWSLQHMEAARCYLQRLVTEVVEAHMFGDTIYFDHQHMRCLITDSDTLNQLACTWAELDLIQIASEWQVVDAHTARRHMHFLAQTTSRHASGYANIADPGWFENLITHEPPDFVRFPPRQAPAPPPVVVAAPAPPPPPAPAAQRTFHVSPSPDYARTAPAAPAPATGPAELCSFAGDVLAQAAGDPLEDDRVKVLSRCVTRLLEKFRTATPKVLEKSPQLRLTLQEAATRLAEATVNSSTQNHLPQEVHDAAEAVFQAPAILQMVRGTTKLFGMLDKQGPPRTPQSGPDVFAIAAVQKQTLYHQQAQDVLWAFRRGGDAEAGMEPRSPRIPTPPPPQVPVKVPQAPPMGAAGGRVEVAKPSFLPSVAPPPPPPPPPPQPSDRSGLPPPAANAAGAQHTGSAPVSREAMLAQIRLGLQLKKVPPKEVKPLDALPSRVNPPDAPKAEEEKPRGNVCFRAEIAAALKKRREAVQPDPEASTEEEWAESAEGVRPA